MSEADVISVTMRYTAADFAEAYRKAMAPLNALVFGGTMLVVGLSVVAFDAVALPWGVAATLLGGYFVYGWWKAYTTGPKRFFERCGGGYEYTTRLSTVGVQMKSEYAMADYTWKAFTSYDELNNLFRLTLFNSGKILISKRNLDESLLARLRTLLAEQIPNGKAGSKLS